MNHLVDHCRKFNLILTLIRAALPYFDSKTMVDLYYRCFYPLASCLGGSDDCSWKGHLSCTCVSYLTFKLYNWAVYALAQAIRLSLCFWHVSIAIIYNFWLNLFLPFSESYSIELYLYMLSILSLAINTHERKNCLTVFELGCQLPLWNVQSHTTTLPHIGQGIEIPI